MFHLEVTDVSIHHVKSMLLDGEVWLLASDVFNLYDIAPTQVKAVEDTLPDSPQMREAEAITAWVEAIATQTITIIPRNPK